MGEARRRGTFEMRKAEAIERDQVSRARLAERLQEEAQRRQQTTRQPTVTLSRRPKMLLGVGLALAASTLWPRGV